MRVDVVGGPRGANGLLSSDVPHDELDVFVDHLFHVAPYRRRRRHHLVEEPSPPPATSHPAHAWRRGEPRARLVGWGEGGDATVCRGWWSCRRC